MLSLRSRKRLRGIRTIARNRLPERFLLNGRRFKLQRLRCGAVLCVVVEFLFKLPRGKLCRDVEGIRLLNVSPRQLLRCRRTDGAVGAVRWWDLQRRRFDQL